MSVSTLAALLVFSPLLAALLILVLAWLAQSRVPFASIIHAHLRPIQDAVTIAASVVSLILAVLLASSPTSGHASRFGFPGIDFYLDALSVYFVLLVNIVALVASFYTGYYLRSESETPARQHPDSTLFHLFFNLFHFTMVLVPMVDNLVILWIAVELTTVASTVLVGFRGDRRALEAAWKYIITTSTGIIFALLGTLFLANAIPAGEPINWSRLVEIAHNLDPNFVKLSFLFVLVGYGTKAGFAPMHTWLPDGHGEAPYPVSALLSGVLLKSALYAILRFYTITNITLNDSVFTALILLGSGLFSLAIAVPLILKRNRFKRVLAYHSLEHMGIITFGLGIGTEVALFGALLHVLNHALTKALMFLAFGNVQSSYARVGGKEEEHYVGVLRVMPATGILIALGGLALVGSPPFNIFLSEFIILWAAVTKALQETSWGLIAAIGLFLISVTLIFAGLVRHLGGMLIGMPPAGTKPETPGQVLPLLGLFAVVLVFGITVPQIGPLDLPQLLKQSVNIVRCGASICP